MSAKPAFSDIPDSGYLGFAKNLDESDWGAIDTGAHERSGHQVADFASLPQLVAFKLKLRWSIAEFASALGQASADEVNRLDEAWDNPQRRLDLILAYHASNPDPARGEAARRLRSLMLKGQGTSQTALSYDQEVAHGRMQGAFLDATEHPEVAAAVDLLELRPLFAEIQAATEALASAIGLLPGQTRRLAPSVRVKTARSRCLQAFSSVHSDLGFWLERTPPGPTLGLLQALRQPLTDLLERSQIERSSPAKPASPTEPAAS